MDDSEITETDIWASPSQLAARPRPKSPRTPKTPKTPTSSDPVDPEVALRRELEGVRKVNEAVEGIIATLERTGSNMTVSSLFAHVALPPTVNQPEANIYRLYQILLVVPQLCSTPGPGSSPRPNTTKDYSCTLIGRESRKTWLLKKPRRSNDNKRLSDVRWRKNNAEKKYAVGEMKRRRSVD